MGDIFIAIICTLIEKFTEICPTDRKVIIAWGNVLTPSRQQTTPVPNSMGLIALGKRNSIRGDQISSHQLHRRHKNFYPRPGYFLVLSLPVYCVCVSITCLDSGPVQARITKFGPKIQKKPCLRSLLLCMCVCVGGGGGVDHGLQGQIKLEIQNFPYFELVRTITHHLFKLGSPNLYQRCKTPWMRSLVFWGAIDLDLQGQIWLKSKIFWLHHNWKYIPPYNHQRAMST